MCKAAFETHYFNQYMKPERMMTSADVNRVTERFIAYKNQLDADFAKFSALAQDHLAYVEKCMNEGNFCVVGSIQRTKPKYVLMIFRFPDESEITVRKSFEKIAEARKIIAEYQSYGAGDWTGFEN